MRQRIVINVDGPATETVQRPRTSGRKPRRWLRVLAILVGLMIVIFAVTAVLGFLWWRSLQQSPAYSLTLLLDAAQRNDATEFEKRIDDDEIAKNMAASVSQKAAARYGVAMNNSVQSQIDKQVPALLPQLKQTVHDEVVKQIKEFAAQSEPQPFLLLFFAVRRLVTVETVNDTANVKATLKDRRIELTMQRDGDRWKVTGFKDDAVVQRIVDNVMKALPPIGSIESNSPLFKRPTRRRAR
jgi:hypothetical protein